MLHLNILTVVLIITLSLFLCDIKIASIMLQGLDLLLIVGVPREQIVKLKYHLKLRHRSPSKFIMITGCLISGLVQAWSRPSTLLSI